MSDNKNLHKANKEKNDEFYTMLSDIEAELQHYEHHFKDKVVYCNCDNPEWSNFWKYFKDNFERLGLKRLIATYYDNDNQVYRTDLISDTKNELNRFPLKGNGDFRSQECIDILKTADIVVTNPPFSLFREYVGQLIEYEKKFLIIGNMNAITYKEFFPLLKNNKVWIGATIHSGDREFRVPDNYPLQAAGYRIDNYGNKYIRVKGVRWFTNLKSQYNYEYIKLYKTYNSIDYPKYDNYDAINVDKTKDIPIDYDGIMGVPISFMDKYCPEQFEIVGISGTSANSIYIEGKKKSGRFYINGKRLYDRILIKRRQ